MNDQMLMILIVIILQVILIIMHIYSCKLRKQACSRTAILNKSLEESEKLFRLLTENAQDIIYRIKLHPTPGFEYISPVVTEILGYTPEEYYRDFNLCLDRVYSEDLYILENILSDRVQYDEFVVTRFSHKDGRLVWLEQRNVPIYDENHGLIAIEGIARDTTERRKTEENLAYEQLKNEFFSNISHELRTPLNIIFSTAQLMELHIQQLEGELKEKINKYIRITKQNSYRLMRLLNNLIDITKIDAGFFELHLENHNIVQIVEEITLSVVPYIEAKNIHIEFDTNVEESFIACDPDQIERIILNILSNAYKFTDEGGAIFVNLYSEEEKVRISIRDTGIGIPKDKIEMVFQRFRQVNSSFVKRTEGSGIGLSLVKYLVELHGGKISLQSSYGEGSEFVIELPVKLTKEPVKIVNIEDIRQKNIEKISIEFSDIYT